MNTTSAHDATVEAGIKGHVECTRTERGYRVFVYGSLLSELGNHSCLGDAPKICDAISAMPHYAMFSLGAFPVVSDGGDDNVIGELYDVTAEQLRRLHRLESHPNWYTAHVRTFVGSDGNEVAALIYLGKEGVEPVDGACWKSYLKAKGRLGS